MKWLRRVVVAGTVMLAAGGVGAMIWRQAVARDAEQQRGEQSARQQSAEPTSSSDSREASVPDEAQKYYEQAYACGARKDFAGAAEHFQKVLDEYPDSELADDAQYQKAICYFAQGDYEQAMAEFEKVKEQFGDSYLAVRAEGWIDKARVKQVAASGKVWVPVVYDETARAAPPARSGPPGAAESAQSRLVEVNLEELAPLAYEHTAPAPPLPECGPQALAIVCEQLGIPAQTEELAELAGTDESGTSMYGLQQAAQAKGLTVEGLQVDLAYLYQVKKPVIAWIGQNHYVVVTAVDQRQVEFIDPDRGRLAMAVADFSKIWDGHILTVCQEGKP